MSDKPITQLSLLKSFITCLKSIDNNLQIMPIRNDIKIHPLTTTDHIQNLPESGPQPYFKAYKKTLKHFQGTSILQPVFPLPNWKPTKISKLGSTSMVITSPPQETKLPNVVSHLPNIEN